MQPGYFADVPNLPYEKIFHNSEPGLLPFFASRLLFLNFISHFIDTFVDNNVIFLTCKM